MSGEVESADDRVQREQLAEAKERLTVLARKLAGRVGPLPAASALLMAASELIARSMPPAEAASYLRSYVAAFEATMIEPRERPN